MLHASIRIIDRGEAARKWRHPQITGVTVIHILWKGPFSIDAALSRRFDNDYGLYQIYGTHPVFGEDALLRVGQANGRTFFGRLPWYQGHWEQSEPDGYSI